MSDISAFELGWLVGILEGEGYFEYNGCSQKVTLRMTDEDSVNTYASIVSRIIEKEINVSGYFPSGKRRQEIFEAQVCGENARTLMRFVAPHMHYRRRARIWQSLNKWRPPNKTITLEEIGL